MGPREMRTGQWKDENLGPVDAVIARLNSLSAYGAFRGQANNEYDLCPTLLRKDECGKPKIEAPEKREVELLSSFCDKARIYFYGPERLYADRRNLLLALPLARHYSVPTRALDWTRDPLIAAYFACASEENEINADGVVWWFDGRHHDREGAFELSLKDHWITHQFKRNISGEVDLSRLFEKDGLPDRRFVTKVYYPPVLDRMTKQKAFLTVAGELQVNQQTMIHSLSKGCCGRVTFPAAIKRDLLRELGLMGIHATALGDTIIDRIGASLH
ncbi:FRG domain protein [Phycisphaerae bacterium RAS2]|nr:FRG domain protein [Phycisphaerae bacterium RAS2]